MMMLTSIVNIRTSECGSDASAEVTDNVLSWIYTFYTKSTDNDRPRAYRKALEALVEAIEKDNTNKQRKAILFVKNTLTYVLKENAEMLQIIFEENDNNEINESRILFTIHSRFQLKFYCYLYAKKCGISIRSLRFSHRGKMMFPSDMADGTSKTLDLRDNDVITVHLLSDPNKENMTDTSNQKHTVTTNNKNKVAWKIKPREGTNETGQAHHDR